MIRHIVDAIRFKERGVAAQDADHQVGDTGCLTVYGQLTVRQVIGRAVQRVRLLVHEDRDLIFGQIRVFVRQVKSDGVVRIHFNSGRAECLAVLVLYRYLHVRLRARFYRYQHLDLDVAEHVTRERRRVNTADHRRAVERDAVPHDFAVIVRVDEHCVKRLPSLQAVLKKAVRKEEVLALRVFVRGGIGSDGAKIGVLGPAGDNVVNRRTIGYLRRIRQRVFHKNVFIRIGRQAADVVSCFLSKGCRDIIGRPDEAVFIGMEIDLSIRQVFGDVTGQICCRVGRTGSRHVIVYDRPEVGRGAAQAVFVSSTDHDCILGGTRHVIRRVPSVVSGRADDVDAFSHRFLNQIVNRGILFREITGQGQVDDGDALINRVPHRGIDRCQRAGSVLIEGFDRQDACVRILRTDRVQHVRAVAVLIDRASAQHGDRADNAGCIRIDARINECDDRTLDIGCLGRFQRGQRVAVRRCGRSIS